MHDFLFGTLSRALADVRPGQSQSPTAAEMIESAAHQSTMGLSPGGLPAAFSGQPGGSISGAPKLRACQRLHELEPTSRGPYCGSLLRVDWDGSFDSNILIRSLLRQGDTLRAHAGCGIVADSDPLGEAEELMWKLQPLLEALA